MVIVPTWRDVHERAPEAVLQALRDAHARGAVLVGLCLGAFVLAQAGVLDARRATTHWASCAMLAERHPDVEVDPDPIFVRDGHVFTSAGVTAARLARVFPRNGPPDAVRISRFTSAER